jgi:hypothetical protein
MSNAINVKRAPISKENLIMMINLNLRKDWTYDDYANGKPIDLHWDWKPVLGQALNSYRDKGWEIQVSVVLDGRGKKLHLRFKNPKWQLRDEELST